MASPDEIKSHPLGSAGCARTGRIEAADLEAIHALFDRGLSRQAFDRAQTFGPFRTWQGTQARILASRIAADLGAPRLAHTLQVRAYRADPTNTEARAFFIASTLERRGPLAAWQQVRRMADATEDGAANKDAIEYLLSLRARVAGIWRDFETANRLLEQAGRISPDSAWLAVERSFLLEQEDRYEECLASAQRALQLRPWYRPGVLATAHALQLLDRDEEALDLLRGSTRHLESAPVLMQLAALQCELDCPAEAKETLEALTRLSPILEKEGRDWLVAQQSLVAYRLGNFQEAAEHARERKEPHFQKFSERLAASSAAPRRVRLPVAFVRQHRVTCSPATLAALAGFWNRPAEHLAIAEEVCYDGTPAHSERHWTEQNGFIAREFTVTWDTAVALLERGIPFALHTVEIAGGHAQAVIGFDALRETLLIRDPFHYYTAEADAEALFERYRSTGPRGMAIVPKERADLLLGIELPDAAIYDQLHAVHRALAGHQRGQAWEMLGQMHATAPSHRLTFAARHALAAYDANTPALLESVDALLEQFPGDGRLSLVKLRCLGELSRREDRLALLQAVCDRADADPIFWQQYAIELGTDARRNEEAQRWLRRAIRRRPGDVNNLALLAEQWWKAQRFDEALELYRFTACVAELQEGPALAYFSAARWLQRTDEALQFLRQRVRRWSAKSFQPVGTLFRAYAQIDELPQAFAVLEAAVQQRRNDGDLLLFAADVHARFGKLDEAAGFLQAAAGCAQRTRLLRVAAQLAELRGEPAKALENWREILAIEPLALDAHQSATRLLAHTAGRAAAVENLEEVCHRFPHHFGLHQLWIAWMHDEGARATERVIRRLVDSHPESGWARRELALALGAQGRLPEALVESRRALQLDPHHPQSHCVRGLLLAQGGDDDAARESFRGALGLAVDAPPAIQGLLETCRTPRERSDALALIAEELRRQQTFGNSLLSFRAHARLDWTPERLLEFLREMLRERPMLWQARVAVVHQLAEMSLLDEALKVAQEATTRLPLIPEPWFALAFVHRVRGDWDGELAALKELLRIHPDESSATSQLADFHARQGDFPEARSIAEKACARNPLDARPHALLASLLWRAGEREAAMDKVQHALRLNPEDDWSWRAFSAWAAELKRSQIATSHARDLVARRKGEARPCLRLAFALANENQPAEALKMVERALELNPRLIEAHDAKAALLCQLNRHDDALDVCTAKIWSGRVPVELRLRAAWTIAQRDDLPHAIRDLRQLLELHPGCYAGWRDLAEWCWRRGDESGALTAVSQMMRLAPLDPQPYCFLAEIKNKRRDRDGAKMDFRHALRLDPGFAHAGSGLFDMQLADGEIELAEATLKVLQQQVGGKLAEDSAARLESLRAKQQRDNQTIEHLRRTSRGGEEFEAAVQSLRALCADPAAEPAAIEGALRRLENTGNRDEARKIVREALENPQANPEVGALWVRAKIARKEWGLSTRLDELMQRNAEVGRRAVMAYARALGAAKRKKSLHYLLKEHGRWLKADPRGWASVGMALVTTGEARKFLRWTADWRQQKDAGQDIFASLVLALRAKGRDREADEAARLALAQPRQSDAAFDELTLWIAAEDAVAGRTREARESLKQVAPEVLATPLRRIHRLVQSLVEIQSAPRGEMAEARKAALRRVRHAFANVRLFSAGRATRRIFRRALRRMSIDSRSVGPFVWTYWRLYGAIFLASLAFLAIPVILMAIPYLAWPLFLVAGAYLASKSRRERMSGE